MEILLGFCLCVALVAVVIYWRVRHWPRLRVPSSEPIRCSGCGYDLTGLTIPRCPECGALRGFKVPLTSLGLREEDIRQRFKGGQSGETSANEPAGEAEDNANSQPAARG